MRRNLLDKVMVGLFVALTFGLAGCGGGGGNDNSGNTSAAGPLAKYAGTWVQGCDGHSRETTTFTSSNDGNTISVTSKDEYFADANCTGAVVATGTYEQPSFILQYKDTVNNASVKMLNGTTITATVDRGTGNSTGARVKYVGSGVTSSSIVGNTTKVHIVYNGGSTDLEIDDSSGGGEGALLLLNNELLSLYPVTSTTFEVESRYIH